MKLESFKFEDEELSKARDFFCFCCFTSLRYSDAFSLKKTAIHEDYFDIVSQKTDKTLKIDLNDHSRKIVKRYKDSPGDFILPRFTVARLNVLVKKIGKIIGLDTLVIIKQYYGSKKVERSLKKWELLSTHSGRRTFVCNALALGIAPHIVMKWTGHANMESMKPYIDVADPVRINAMKNFNGTDSIIKHTGDKKRRQKAPILTNHIQNYPIISNQPIKT